MTLKIAQPALSGGKFATDEQIAEAKTLKEKVEAGIARIAGTADLSQYLSFEDQAKLAAEKILLEADLALLDTYIATGVLDPAAADGTGVETGAGTMPIGWNDAQGPIDVVTDDADAQLVHDGTYAGTIHLATSGQYNAGNPTASNALSYVVPTDVKNVSSKTVGEDILWEIEKADGTRETYVLKSMAVRSEQIYTDASHLKTGVVIDHSRSIRVSNGAYGQPFGEINGFAVIGSKSHDKIIGSQGNDVLVGSGGNDLIYGLAGNDRLYGDELVQGQFHETDGSDVLIGGDGNADTYFGGGGSQDRTVKGAGEISSEAETVEIEEFTTLPPEAIAQAIAAPGWTPTTDPATGEIAIELDSDVTDGGVIDFQLPPGFDMISGRRDSSSNDLLLTAGGFDDLGNPVGLRVRIKDFFDPDVHARLRVLGNAEANILDFHDVVMQGNLIDLYGKAGEDTIIAPRSELDGLGIDLATLGHSTVSAKALKNTVAKLRGSDGILNWGNYDWANGSNPDNAGFVMGDEIVLAPDPTKPLEQLALTTPEGFTHVMLQMDPEHPNDVKILLINKTADRTDQVVVRIVGGAAIADQITWNGIPITTLSGATAEAQGGAGNDTVFGSFGSATLTAETVISGHYAYPSPPSTASAKAADDGENSDGGAEETPAAGGADDAS
ncbi:MAG: hypothetical protein HY543_05800 [Deltaproteobacteria bacterium]|nr:hypothetical protein [Deltaproteobacteria bacterium]